MGYSVALVNKKGKTIKAKDKFLEQGANYVVGGTHFLEFFVKNKDCIGYREKR